MLSNTSYEYIRYATSNAGHISSVDRLFLRRDMKTKLRKFYPKKY